MYRLRRFALRLAAFGLLMAVAVVGATAQGGKETASSGSVGSADGVTTWHGLPVHSAHAALTFPIIHSDATWRGILDPNQYYILRQAGTEPPFSGKLLDEHRKGIFYSAATGEPLFRSSAKFDSGTGWPSFYEPIRQNAVVLRWDNTLGMQRVEVLDSSSGSHLGHVFDDGPAPTGLRYCMDSGALLFVPDGGAPPPIVVSYLKEHPNALAN